MIKDEYWSMFIEIRCESGKSFVAQKIVKETKDKEKVRTGEVKTKEKKEGEYVDQK